jgi:hypothetical protein
MGLHSLIQGELFLFYLSYYGHLGSEVHQTTLRDIPEDCHPVENLESHINYETSIGGGGGSSGGDV